MKILIIILASAGFFAVAMAFLAIGVIIRGRPIQHTCGASKGAADGDRCATCSCSGDDGRPS